MKIDPVALSIISSLISPLLSGIVSVGVSIFYFYKLERHKCKLDLARRLLGNRYNVRGDAFSCAMNEAIAVFADSEDVLLKMARLHETLTLQAKDKSDADSALIDFLNSVCKASGLSRVTLNDTYLLKVFNARN